MIHCKVNHITIYMPDYRLHYNLQYIKWSNYDLQQKHFVKKQFVVGLLTLSHCHLSVSTNIYKPLIIMVAKSLAVTGGQSLYTD